MKRTLVVSLLTLALVPVATYAQSDGPLTRAQVRSELAQLRQAGYVGDTDASYPEKLQEAERRVADSGVGRNAAGAVESGQLTRAAGAGARGLAPSGITR